MCPPGVDQTCRTRERWTLLTPLLKEKTDITDEFYEDYESRPQKFILGSYTWDAFDKLAQCDKRELDVRSLLSSLPPSRFEKASALERMPAELLNMVVTDPALDSRDIVALGLSSQCLWLHLLAHVSNACWKAPWAGTPLLCTGTYTMSVPPVIHYLYPDIKREEAEFFVKRGVGPRRGFPRGTCPARRFNWGAIGDYLDRTEHDHKNVWLTSFAQLSATSCIPGKHVATLLKSLKAALNVRTSTEHTTWVLRNRTANEFITLKVGRIHGKQENDVHVKGIPWLSLDKALILRICWSVPHDYDVIDQNLNGLQRLVVGLKTGSWAGHKFDVVGAESVELDESWRDVTDEITKEGKAWKRAFGGE